MEYIDYNLLDDNENIYPIIESSFGKDGLGLIVIKNIPDLQKSRLELLQAIHSFAGLPEIIKQKYIHRESNYSFGWSHGKEFMKQGIADTAKGSYYANPVIDSFSDNKLSENYPELYSDNIWPTEELPNFEKAFKSTSSILISIGQRISQLLDSYLYKKTNGKHSLNTFYNLISQSQTYKGRLLHYFPISDKNQLYNNDISEPCDNFCGWHVDHGCLTILLSPLFLNIKKEIQVIDDSGLYVRTQTGKNQKIHIPEDCIVIQLGEMFQYMSGGMLRATPHCVQSTHYPNISREQFALFMDFHPNTKLILPEYSLPIQEVLTCKNLPSGVPTLESRINNVVTYSDFVKKTIHAYYK